MLEVQAVAVVLQLAVQGVNGLVLGPVVQDFGLEVLFQARQPLAERDQALPQIVLQAVQPGGQLIRRALIRAGRRSLVISALLVQDGVPPSLVRAAARPLRATPSLLPRVDSASRHARDRLPLPCGAGRPGRLYSA